MPELSSDLRSRGAVLVTGGASGIGWATARRCAKDGYSVLVGDLDEDAARKVAAELPSEPGTHSSVGVDVVDGDAMSSAVAAFSKNHGPFVGAVACAGVEVLGDIETLSPVQWQRSLDVNLTGVFNTARAVIGDLKTTRGSFVAVTSDAGVTGARGYAAYCAAKHGIVGLIKAMALDYGPAGVRSNAVAPSFVHTPMADRIFGDTPDEIDFYRDAVPLGRFAQPSEVASAIAHLLSTESSYTNGSIYRIDGGSTAGYFVPVRPTLKGE